jgi:cytoskeleton protein RodZ
VRAAAEPERDSGRSRAGRGVAVHAGIEPAAAEAAVSAAPAELHAGLLLRRAREQRGLSVQDIAKRTRIADRFITAIEEARLEQLPAPVFAIGYVRNYARAVGLDPGDAVERFRALGQKREGSMWGARSDKTGVAQKSPEQLAAQRKYMLWTAASLLLGLAALLAIWLRSRH